MSDDFTGLLRAWGQGDRDARARIWPALYPELKIISRSVLRRFTAPGSPGTTSLVHEAALRLLKVEIDWTDRRHFYAAAAKAMRFVAVDEARRKTAQKRGADALPEVLEEDSSIDARTQNTEQVLAVHQALNRLAKVNERHEQLVELRFFAGMTVDETAEAMGVSKPTVVRDWRAVRVWLHDQLASTESFQERV